MAPLVENVTHDQARAVSYATVVPATASAVFALLTDTSRHAEVDGSGTVKGTRGAGTLLTGVGDTFGMRMRLGLPYVMRNTVVEFEQDRLIAWRHFGGHRWRYELAEVKDGTQIVETFDWAPAVAGVTYESLRIPGRNARSIRATLERFHTVFTG